LLKVIVSVSLQEIAQEAVETTEKSHAAFISQEATQILHANWHDDQDPAARAGNNTSAL
jgi:hypothetical protein